MKEGSTQLFYREMSQIVGTDEMTVLVLTDAARERALSVVCDGLASKQLLLRMQSSTVTEIMLPEVLLYILKAEGAKISDYEMLIFAITNGQYKVMLESKTTSVKVPIRISDAVLLNMVADVPLYILDTLFSRQMTAYEPQVAGIRIPINAISLEQLKQELQKAISEEDYRVAAQLQEEIEKRNNK
jgi:hypothetical protein